MHREQDRSKQEFHSPPASGDPFSGDLEETGYDDGQGQTPLYIAAKNENANLVKELLQKGVDVNERDNDGRTALHYATTADVLRVLLECPDIEINLTDNEGRTALHYATMRGERLPLRVLLEKGIDPNVRDKYDKTSYDYSAGEMEVIAFDRALSLISSQLG